MRGKKEFSVEGQPTSGVYTSSWIGFRTQKEACQAFLRINSHSAFSEVQLWNCAPKKLKLTESLINAVPL